MSVVVYESGRVVVERGGKAAIIDRLPNGGFTITSREEVPRVGGGSETVFMRVEIDDDDAIVLADWLSART